MTNAQLLSALRAQLDEVANGFWDDTVNLYPSLANGQREYMAIVLAQYLGRLAQNINEPVPLTLIPLYLAATGTVGSGTSLFTKPANYEFDIDLKVVDGSTTYNLRKRDISPSTFFKQSNPYLSANLAYYYIDGTNVNIERGTNNNSLAYTFGYLKTLTDISASVQPTLPDFTHNAIIQYALAESLLKAKMMNESQAAFNKFLQLVQYR